jgi:hypothetical protein
VWATLFSSVLLIGCDRASQAPVENSRTSLAGEWDLILQDGVPVIPLSFGGSETTFYYRPACAGYGLTYDIDGDRVSFQNPRSSGVTTVCLPTIPDEVPQLLNALLHTSQIEHNPDRSVELRGGGHSLVFAPTRNKVPRIVDSLEGRWLIDQIDGRTVVPNEANILVGDAYSLSWSVGCTHRIRNYAIVANRFAAYSRPQTSLPPPPPPPLSVQAPQTKCDEQPSPIVEQAFAVIDEVTTVGKRGRHDVELRRGDGSGLKLKRIDALETLVGEWSVIEQIEQNGQSPSEAIGIILSITARDISFEPVCAGFTWRYTYADNALATRRPDGVKPGPDFQALPCFVGVGLAKARLAKILDAATRADLTPEGNVVISGPRGTVRLALR